MHGVFRLSLVSSLQCNRPQLRIYHMAVFVLRSLVFPLVCSALNCVSWPKAWGQQIAPLRPSSLDMNVKSCSRNSIIIRLTVVKTSTLMWVFLRELETKPTQAVKEKSCHICYVSAVWYLLHDLIKKNGVLPLLTFCGHQKFNPSNTDKLWIVKLPPADSDRHATSHAELNAEQKKWFVQICAVFVQ